MAKMAKDNRSLALTAMVAMAVALVLSALIPVRALADELPDPSKTGSISLTMQDSKGKAVSGGELTIYQVATIDSGDEGYYFKPTSGFDKEVSGINEQLTEKQVENPTSSFVTSLVKAAADVKGTTQSIGTDGTISFKDLSTGVYLVVQTKPADGYKAVSSFLVSIPYNKSGKLIYDLTDHEIRPKVGTVTATTTTPSKSTPKASTPSYTHSSSAKLPQTGQLWWPVWILGVAGGALLVIGLVARSRSGQENRPAKA